MAAGRIKNQKHSLNIGTKINTLNTEVKRDYIKLYSEDGKLIGIKRNPDWVEEIDRPKLKSLAPCKKIWNPTPLSILRLQKSNRNKKLPVLFDNELTPDQVIQKLKNYKLLNQKAKIDIVSYLSYCVEIHGLKILYPTQGHIGAVIGISRVWANEKLAELEEDGFLKSLYRHLCSKLYGVSSSIFSPDIIEQLSEFFPWIKYHENKAIVAEFTQQINLRFIKYNLVDNVIVNNVVNNPKKGNSDPFLQNLSNIRSNTPDISSLLSKVMGGLCL